MKRIFFFLYKFNIKEEIERGRTNGGKMIYGNMNVNMNLHKHKFIIYIKVLTFQHENNSENVIVKQKTTRRLTGMQRKSLTLFQFSKFVYRTHLVYAPHLCRYIVASI